MRGKVGCAMALGMALSMAAGGGAWAENLKAAVRTALKTHPEISAMRQNKAAIGQELKAAKGLWMPKVDVVAKAGGYLHKDTRQERFEVSAVLTQPLFDGGRGRFEQKRQKARVASARARLEDTANAVALRVVQAYMETLRARSVLAAAKRNLAALRKIAAMVRRRARAGQGDAAETAQAAARIAAARAALAEARQRLNDARALYVTVVGHAPRKLAGLPSPGRHMPRSLTAALRLAVRNAPRINALKQDAAAASAAIGSARSALMPRLDLELSGNYVNELEHISPENLHGKAMVVMKWNLFNGGINRARVSEAKYRASEARALTFAAGLDIERNLRLAWNAMVAGRARAAQLRRQLAANRRSLSIQKRQFEAGTRTLLDILDTQNEIFASETALANERTSSRYHAWKVLALAGRLLPALRLSAR